MEAQATTQHNSQVSTPLDTKTMPHTSKRFKAEPIETTQRSNRAAVLANADGDDAPLLPHERAVNKSIDAHSHSPGRRKFAVEPVETTSRSNRQNPSFQSPATDRHPTPQSQSPTSSSSVSQPASSRRKFKVEMIETAKRSRRSGDTMPAVRPEDKTNGLESESFKNSRSLSDVKTPRPPLAPANTPAISTNGVPLAQRLKPQPNRQGSIHAHYTTRANTRQHSFKVPSLEAIDSSESSPAHSSPQSRSSSHASRHEGYMDATRMRESVDDRFSGYLLALAARAAEKQLRDQEAAIFPAPDTHEPIVHYVDSEGSSREASRQATQQQEQPTMATYRRDSADEDVAMQEMRKHGEEMHKKQEQEASGRRKTGAFNVEFDTEAAQDAWMSNAGVQPANARSIDPPQRPAPAPAQTGAKPNNLIGGYQKDPDLKQMRKAASPPMLGGDLDFPRCPSPEHARFDVTQGSEFLKNNMCYLNNAGEEGGATLWGRRSDTKTSLKSTETNKSGGGGRGLWGGHCTHSDAKLSSLPTGIVTPRRTPLFEKDDPFQSLSAVTASTAPPNTSKRPPSPPPSNTSNVSLSPTPHPITPVVSDPTLTREFPDVFVTQVYNYLSLGFPALARKFDDELAKISGFDVDHLRRDDKLADQRGYLRLGSDEVDVLRDEEEPVHEEMCVRWKALRVYVREWGRQMGVGDERERARLDPSRAWGVAARKGSWGG